MGRVINSGLALLLACSLSSGCATHNRLKKEETEARQKLYDRYEIVFEKQSLSNPFTYFLLGDFTPSETHWILDTSRLDRLLEQLRTNPTNVTLIINNYTIDGVNYQVEKDTNFPDRLYLRKTQD